MKKSYKQLFGSALLSAGLCICSAPVIAQLSAHQLVIANGGDFANPNDYVTVSTYHIDSNQYKVIDTIFTQSVQDVHVYAKTNESAAYVAAQDSIVMYDLLSGQRQAEVEMKGVQTLERIEVKGMEYLLVSKGFGADSIYFEILDAYALTHVTQFTDVDDECAGIAIYKDSAYVAMPGNWMSTTGKIHVIDLSNLKYSRTIDLDSAGAGIYDLFVHENILYSLNSLGWGSTIGVMSAFNLSSDVLTHDTIQGSFNAYAEAEITKNGTLLFSLNGKLASFDLTSKQISDSSLISTNYSALAQSEDNIFLTNTAYSVNANLYRHSLSGMLEDSMQVGIAAEAMDIEYRESTVGWEEHDVSQLQVYPNPCRDILHINGLEQNARIELYNIAGVRVLQQSALNSFETLDLSGFNKGAYILICRSSQDVFQQKIVIQ